MGISVWIRKIGRVMRV